MIFLFLVDLFSVVLVDGGLGVAEFTSFLLLLLLESLVTRGVLKHALRVLVPASFKLLQVLFILHLLLLLELVIDFVLTGL